MNTNEQISKATPVVVVKSEHIPVRAHVVNIPLPNDLTDEMFHIYNLSKTTRVLAAIDICFALIYSFYNLYFFMAFCIAFSGYYGAKNYNNCSLIIYSGYLFLNNFIRIIAIISAIQYYHEHKDEDTSNMNISIFFAIIICLLNLWIARFVYIFLNLVKQLTQENKVKLILMEQQRRIAPNYIWNV